MKEELAFHSKPFSSLKKDSALQLSTEAIDLVTIRRIYVENCISLHNLLMFSLACIQILTGEIHILLNFPWLVRKKEQLFFNKA